MLILSFDTCLDKTYVALREDGVIIDSRTVLSNDENYHSAYLISTIASVLSCSGHVTRDLGVISTDAGPGSFTGIRACTTVARTMVQQLNIRGIAISSLEILSKIDKTGDSLVILDARKDSAYVWDKSILGVRAMKEVYELVVGRSVITDDSLYDSLTPYANSVISYQRGDYELGNYLSDITESRLDEIREWNEIKPIYIQPPAITTKKGKQ